MDKSRPRILADDGEPPRVASNLTLPRNPAARAGVHSIQPPTTTFTLTPSSRSEG